MGVLRWDVVTAAHGDPSSEPFCLLVAVSQGSGPSLKTPPLSPLFQSKKPVSCFPRPQTPRDRSERRSSQVSRRSEQQAPSKPVSGGWRAAERGGWDPLPILPRAPHSPPILPRRPRGASRWRSASSTPPRSWGTASCAAPPAAKPPPRAPPTAPRAARPASPPPSPPRARWVQAQLPPPPLYWRPPPLTPCSLFQASRRALKDTKF